MKGQKSENTKLYSTGDISAILGVHVCKSLLVEIGCPPDFETGSANYWRRERLSEISKAISNYFIKRMESEAVRVSSDEDVIGRVLGAVVGDESIVSEGVLGNSFIGKILEDPESQGGPEAADKIDFDLSKIDIQAAFYPCSGDLFFMDESDQFGGLFGFGTCKLSELIPKGLEPLYKYSEAAGSDSELDKEILIKLCGAANSLNDISSEISKAMSRIQSKISKLV